MTCRRGGLRSVVRFLPAKESFYILDKGDQEDQG